MQMMNLMLVGLGWLSLAAASKRKDAVLLSDVKSLTLRNGKQTTNRRISAIPQLRCVGGNARKHYEVDVLRCTNMGSGYNKDDVEWTCQADLPPEFKLGSTDVICEGYSSSNDPYILKGSCGVEYRLQLTDKGEARYGREAKDELGWFGVVCLVFIVSVFAYGIWNQYCRGNRGTQPPGGDHWGGGHPGDDDNNDPPPPYSSKPSTWNRSAPNNGQANQGQNRFGFWPGAAAGAGAGYLAGRWANNQNRNYNSFPGYTRGSDFDNDFGRHDSGPSSSTHTSTGFGGTSRR